MSEQISLREDVDRVLGERFDRTTAGLTSTMNGAVLLTGEPERKLHEAVAIREQILALADRYDALLRGI